MGTDHQPGDPIQSIVAIAPGDVHEVGFSPSDLEHLRSVEYRRGEDSLLYLQPRVSTGQLVINDRYDDVWGETLRLPLPEEAGQEPLQLRLAFEEAGVTISILPDEAEMAFFPRCGRMDGAFELHHARSVQLQTDAAPGSAARRDRGHFDGEDGLAPLGLPLELAVDQLFVTPDGALVVGWLQDPHALVAAIRLGLGEEVSPPVTGHWLRVPRADLQKLPPGPLGAMPARPGFMAYGPLRHRAAAPRPPGTPEAEPWYLEIELADGRIVCRPLPAPQPPGLEAIQRILGATSLAPADMAGVFDKVLGPPLVALHRQIVAAPHACREVVFGTPAPAPRASLVVPLYGRLDFLVFQQAMFSRGGLAGDEVLYVLDNPAQEEELLGLARSAHARFGQAFRILLPDQRQGFGGASNLGLAEARGDYVCFLNSDVFPDQPDWMDRLTADLAADPRLGMVGPMLLFGDGTVQHDGMWLVPQPRCADWPFPEHIGKGLHPRPMPAGLRDVPAITGACMVMRRELAESLGGFDRDYVIGDFEDADLSCQVRAAGLRCAVDRQVTLYHLERQSQGDGGSPWRMNLTLLNAWTFARRWQASLAAEPHAEA